MRCRGDDDGGGGEDVPAAERGVPGAVRVDPQLRHHLHRGGLGRRHLRRAKAAVQLQQAVLAS